MKEENKNEEILQEEIDELDEVLEEIETESEDDYENKYLKLLAEMENLRKRLDQDKIDIIKYRASSFIQSILPTLDMFEMALKADNVSEEMKNWLIGFEMIYNGFKNTLENEGVEEIVVHQGDALDHNLHYAIETIKSDDIPEGHIIEVKQKGYKIHDRLLRPATVSVATDKEGEENE